MRICRALNISPFFSRTSIIWKPSGVSTIWDMTPGLSAMAASENAGQKMDFEAIPSSPPLRALPGSSEYMRARVANFSPLMILSLIARSFSFTARFAASRSGYMHIWLSW